MSSPTKLTERQTDVLRLVAQGFTNKKVATALGLSEYTVAQHLKAIYAALGVTNRVEATTLFLQIPTAHPATNSTSVHYAKGNIAYHLLSLIIGDEEHKN